MSTIVFRFDVTWTTTNSGGWTKTGLPSSTGNNKTLDYPDPALQQIANDLRLKIADLVSALDSNAQATCTLTTTTVT